MPLRMSIQLFWYKVHLKHDRRHLGDDASSPLGTPAVDYQWLTKGEAVRLLTSSPQTKSLAQKLKGVLTE
jgi:hypothetical protein